MNLSAVVPLGRFSTSEYLPGVASESFTLTVPDAGSASVATLNADVVAFSARTNSSVEFAASVSESLSVTIPVGLVCSTLNVVPLSNVFVPLPGAAVSRRRSVAVFFTVKAPLNS